MKPFHITLTILLSLFFFSCEKLEETLGPLGLFNLDPQVNKTYEFKRWELDSLNNKVGDGSIYFEKCVAKNVSFGGVNDAFVSIKFLNHRNFQILDTTYLRVVNGKDIYEWIDTSQIFSNSTQNIKLSLNKRMSNYTWVARIQLSKGENAEYTILPDKYIQFTIDTLTLNIKISFKSKNEGFENITVPAGNFRAYKVKTTMSFTIFYSNNLIGSFDLINYIWISDDLDWWIKQYQPTTFVRLLNSYIYGSVDELVSTQ